MTNMNIFSPRRNLGCTLRIFPGSWTVLAASSVGCGGSCRWDLSAVSGSSGVGTGPWRPMDTAQGCSFLTCAGSRKQLIPVCSAWKTGISQEKGGGAEPGWGEILLPCSDDVVEVEGGWNVAVQGFSLIPAQTQGLGTALKILFSENLIEKIPETGPSYGFQLTRQEIVALFNAFGRWVWDFSPLLLHKLLCYIQFEL